MIASSIIVSSPSFPSKTLANSSLDNISREWASRWGLDYLRMKVYLENIFGYYVEENSQFYVFLKIVIDNLLVKIYIRYSPR